MMNFLKYWRIVLQASEMIDPSFRGEKKRKKVNQDFDIKSSPYDKNMFFTKREKKIYH